MCVSLPSSDIFFHFNFLLSPIWHTPPRELQVLWRFQRLVDLHSSSFPFPHTAITLRAGSHLLFFCFVSHQKKMYTDLFHVQVVFNTMSLYRLLHGLVLYAIWLSSREASRISTSSHLQEYSFTHAFIQGGLTSSPSFIGGFTSSPSCIYSFKEVLLALLAFDHSWRFY